jgi:hypothetical protein
MPPGVLSAYVADETAYFTLVLFSSGEFLFRVARISLIGAVFAGACLWMQAAADTVMAAFRMRTELAQLKREHAALDEKNRAMWRTEMELITKNMSMQETIEKILGACRDPVTLECTKQPVMLQCGHFVERTTMDRMRALWMRGVAPVGEPLRCLKCFQPTEEDARNQAIRFVWEIIEAVAKHEA